MMRASLNLSLIGCIFIILQGCLAENVSFIRKHNNYEKAMDFYDASLKKIKSLEQNRAGILEAKRIVENARSHEGSVTRYEDGRKILDEFKNVSSVYLTDTAMLLMKKSISDTNALPNEKQSIKLVDKIQQSTWDYKYFFSDVKTQDIYYDLDDKLDSAAKTKKSLIWRTIKNNKCSTTLPSTGLPKSLHKLEIWGIHANAVQYRNNFKSLFCGALNKGSKVKYIKPKPGTTNYGMQLKNDISTSILIFAKLPNEKAWILKDVYINGEKKMFTTKEAIALLLALS